MSIICMNLHAGVQNEIETGRGTTDNSTLMFDSVVNRKYRSYKGTATIAALLTYR